MNTDNLDRPNPLGGDHASNRRGRTSEMRTHKKAEESLSQVTIPVNETRHQTKNGTYRFGIDPLSLFSENNVNAGLWREGPLQVRVS